MLYSEERKRRMVEYVNRSGRASVQELSTLLEVSESTIRRDLKELEDEHLLRRAHGGAISLQSVNFEPTFTEKEDKYQREKQAIAQKAIELIEEGDTILLDSGTTTHHLIPELKAFSRITVVTNSLLIAQELKDSTNIELLVLGGTWRRETYSLVGPMADQALQMIRVDKAFIATNGLDLKEGLTTPNLIEAETKKNMIKAAKQVILLTDHSKVGVVSFAKVADLQVVDKCIIDGGVSQSVSKALEEVGIDVHIVDLMEEKE